MVSTRDPYIDGVDAFRVLSSDSCFLTSSQDQFDLPVYDYGLNPPLVAFPVATGARFESGISSSTPGEFIFN